MITKPQTRRQFIKNAAIIAAPTIIPASVLGAGAPSNRINMAYIGIGNRGLGVMQAFLAHPEIQGLAVCDVDSKHYGKSAEKKSRTYGREAGKAAVEAHYAKNKPSGKWNGCETYSDYRELLARDDIDAVMVATPDHWHGLITLEALRNGKDVYCEKPVTHFFAEGKQVYKEVAQQNAIFQVGSQQRSDAKFQQAVELVRNGHLGKITKVEVGLPRGHNEPEQDPTIKDPPAHLDYDFWTGPSPMLPYMRARNHWSWRWHSAYGGGQLMDWIGHHNDIAHWGIGMENGGPISVRTEGWTYPETDVYDTPVDYTVISQYPDDITVEISSKHEKGVKWIGEDGWVWVTRGKIDASNKEWLKAEFARGDWKCYDSPSHQRNFTECVLSRKETIAPAENAHRSITPGHIAYIAQEMGEELKWDAKNETIVDNKKAQKKLMALPYRADWKI
jgi:predicted dehydrogenase